MSKLKEENQLRQHTVKKLGWKPDRPDHRDFLFAVQRPDKITKPLPLKVDLRESGFMPEPYDQGKVGSCTANALAGACEFLLKKEECPKVFTPSRLFVYWNERYIEHSTDSDSGAMIRDGIKVLSKIGFPPEENWPYDQAKWAAKPSKQAFDAAKPHVIDSYMRIYTLEEMKGCLAYGYPFTLGMSVYESFMGKEIEKTGELKVPMPNEKEIGGHAVLVVGYDDFTHRFLIRNSWGKDWGLGGYFTAPYAFVTSAVYCQDFWTLRKTPVI